MSEQWTIQRTLEWCRGYLEKHGDENPRLSAEWLLSAATGLSRLNLYVNFDKPLSMEASNGAGRASPCSTSRARAGFGISSCGRRQAC